MNRTIKFRGKRLDNGEWLYGSLSIIYGDRAAILPPNVINHYRVFPATVGQFTGLTDKNGNEIYEGDIVREDGKIALTIWESYGWWIEYENEGELEIESLGVIKDIDTIVEIIGNIHDNPELLKTE